MNKCIFIGNLTRDPEFQTTGSGVSLCRFSIAVNRNYSNSNGEREADFINIVTWRGLQQVSDEGQKGLRSRTTSDPHLRRQRR